MDCIIITDVLSLILSQSAKYPLDHSDLYQEHTLTTSCYGQEFQDLSALAQHSLHGHLRTLFAVRSTVPRFGEKLIIIYSKHLFPEPKKSVRPPIEFIQPNLSLSPCRLRLLSEVVKRKIYRQLTRITNENVPFTCYTPQTTCIVISFPQ